MRPVVRRGRASKLVRRDGWTWSQYPRGDARAPVLDRLVIAATRSCTGSRGDGNKFTVALGHPQERAYERDYANRRARRGAAVAGAVEGCFREVALTARLR